MIKKIRINKRLTALAVWLLFSIVNVVSAQQLISLQPARAIELALQNNETVRKAEKVVERAKANLRVSKAIYLPQVGVTSEYQRQKNGDIDERDYLTRAQMSVLLAQISVKSLKHLILHKKKSVKQRLTTNAQKRRASTLFGIYGTISS